MNSQDIIKQLKSLYNPKNVAGMARFGITSKNTLGISIPQIRAIAKKIGKDHSLAQELWDSGIHEARLLAGFIGDPERVTEKQMERWVRDFDSWDICDQVCSNLFDRTPFAYQKAVEWSQAKEEFIKRAGFVLMACLSVHDKKAGNKQFERFLPLIKQGSTDERNFVKKAVNWALRQIGKRNLYLNQKAIAQAEVIKKMGSRSGRWITSDALRELTSPAVQNRLKSK